jgi:uncharacterized protein (PEP-CTERM system associated)
MKNKGLVITSTLFCFCLLSFTSLSLRSAEFDIIPSAFSSLTYIERVSDSRENFFASEVSPRVLLTYRSSKLQASASVNSRNIYRDTSSDSFESYLTTSYNGRYELYNQRIFLFGNGSQQFNSVNANNLLIDDLVTNPNNLAKTRNNTAGIQAIRLGNAWFNLSGNASASLFESERSSNSETAFETTSYQTSINFTSGERFTFFRWNISSNYREAQRQDSFDTKRRNSSADLNFALNNRFFLTAGARESKQDLNNTAGVDTFRTYSAGLLYQNRRNLLRIAYNTVDQQSQLSNNDDSGFYSIDFRLELSPRTSISGSKGVAFFGDTESFAFNYANRKLRASATYTESVTASSSVFEENSDGVFVCPDTFFSLEDCFVPDTLNYELQPGEQFTDLSTFQDNINDSERIRKNWIFNTGYQFNRITVSVRGSRLQSLFFDDTPNSIQHSISTSLIARLGVRTSLNASLSYIKTEFDSEEPRDSDSYFGSVGANFSIRESFILGLQGQYRSLDSVSQFGDYQERRLLLTLTYSPRGRDRGAQR